MTDPTDAVASALADHAPALAFGVCGGGRSFDLAVALESRGVSFLSVGHEAAGALMAGGAAFAGALGVSISIKGPGLANSLPGIIHNRMERLPTVSISEAFDASAGSERQHKRADHRALIAGADVRYANLGALDFIGALMHQSHSEPRRPIHLDLADGAGEWSQDNAPAIARSDAGDVDALMRGAERPILVVGALALRRGWGPVLARTGLPILTTVAAKGLVDEADPNCAGVVTGTGGELAPEVALLAEADLMVGIALRSEELIAPLHQPPVAAYLDEVDAIRPSPGPARSIESSADLADVLDMLAGRGWATDLISSCVHAARQSLLADRWAPASVFEVLDRTLGDHALVCDTGDFCTAAEHIWMAGPGREFVASANSRFMGSALPMAIGYSLSEPERQVVCAVGDGGICSFPLELRHLADLGLKICVLVMRDGQYTSVLRPRGSRPASVVATPSHSWASFAEVLGIRGEVARAVGELGRSLASWKKGPLLIEVALPAEAPHGLTRIR